MVGFKIIYTVWRSEECKAKNKLCFRSTISNLVSGDGVFSCLLFTEMSIYFDNSLHVPSWTKQASGIPSRSR